MRATDAAKNLPLLLSGLPVATKAAFSPAGINGYTNLCWYGPAGRQSPVYESSDKVCCWSSGCSSVGGRVTGEIFTALKHENWGITSGFWNYSASDVDGNIFLLIADWLFCKENIHKVCIFVLISNKNILKT